MLVLYTKSGCPWCNEVREFLDAKSIAYGEREVSGDAENFAELVEKSGQDKTPTLEFNGEILVDTDREAVERFLKGRGFIS